MSEDRMPRAGENGVSALERLRQLVRENPAEGEFLKSQKKQMSALKVIAMIEARHQIYGLDAQRLSDFWRFLRLRKARTSANDAVLDLREMCSGETDSPEALHKWLTDLLMAVGLEESNLKVLAFVTGEIRKVMAMRDAKEKFHAAQMDKIEAGLEAVFQEIKSDPVAVELHEKIVGRMRDVGALAK